jgi:transcription initiation factor TFIID TATA-box-binding protein
MDSTIEPDSDLSRYRQEERASPVIIKNCVATAFFGCRLDLKEIAWKCHAEFDPRSFAAAKLRVMNPQATALLFASGKIVCTGAPSEESARVAVTEIYRMVSAIMPPAATALLDVNIENIVGTAHLGHSISLKRAYEWMRGAGDVTVLYAPELFPGMRFEIKKWAQKYMAKNHLEGSPPATKVLAFPAGNVVITGGKSKLELLITWIAIRNLLARFGLTDQVRLFIPCAHIHIHI